MTWLNKFFKFLSGKAKGNFLDNISPFISVRQIESAETIIMAFVQTKVFSHEIQYLERESKARAKGSEREVIDSLDRLVPFVAENGLLCVGWGSFKKGQCI